MIWMLATHVSAPGSVTRRANRSVTASMERGRFLCRLTGDADQNITIVNFDTQEIRFTTKPEVEMAFAGSPLSPAELNKLLTAWKIDPKSLERRG